MTPQVQPITKKKREKVSSHKRACDDLVRKIVHAPGVCEAAGRYGVECAGPLNCCHIIRRTRSGIRCDLSNLFLACHAHHTWLDNHNADMQDFIGEDRYRALQVKADEWTETGGSSLLFWREERARLTAIARELGIK